MRYYDVIAIGTGSAMNIVEAMLSRDREMRAAVIDKDPPGGICLTRACIPTKLLVHPADIIRGIESASDFGIDATIKRVHFDKVMGRMRDIVDKDIGGIEAGLKGSPNVDYYRKVAEFIEPYTLKVGGETITSKLMLLCTGSKPLIPPIKGLDAIGYHTSDSILGIKRCPGSLAIIGGGYIAAEYGHFFSAMGAKATIIGRNPQFLKGEEPEISEMARRLMGKHMTILTNHEVVSAERGKRDAKRLTARDRGTGSETTIQAEEVLVASGRASNSDILHPERGGIETDAHGWINVNDRLETSQPGVWAFGDAIGVHLFKHVANYESKVVYHNAILGKDMRVDYHAVPHAIFTYPEVAGVGLRESEAIDIHGRENVLIGFQRYEDTAKGHAMNVKDCFVKGIVERESMRILGAHIIGPQASVLIQEVIDLMYTPSQTMVPLMNGIHIHPALSEVVERAFQRLMPVDQYHHLLGHQFNINI